MGKDIFYSDFGVRIIGSIDLVALLRAAALLWAVVTARDRTVKSRGLPWSSALPRAAVALAAALRAPTTAVGNGGCDSPVEGGRFRRPSRGALLTADGGAALTARAEGEVGLHSAGR